MVLGDSSNEVSFLRLSLAAVLPASELRWFLFRYTAPVTRQPEVPILSIFNNLPLLLPGFHEASSH